VIRIRDTPAERIAGAVYGTIVVMGAIAAGAADEIQAGELAGIVAATVIVLWVAHVYSDALGETVARGRRLDVRELADVARRELSIPLAAVMPVGTLLLGAGGVLRETTAGWLAMGFGLATLAFAGLQYASVEGFGRLPTAVAVGVNVMLGLAIVGLKAAVAH
jgi:hypothetical protein